VKEGVGRGRGPVNAPHYVCACKPAAVLPIRMHAICKGSSGRQMEAIVQVVRCNMLQLLQRARFTLWQLAWACALDVVRAGGGGGARGAFE